ncbi:MAG: Rrf2 family transcriptional regulator [Solobacterium sp.]|nr:Rrf2 family transcriptional regulator [Solobacterium sp.]
MQYSSRLTIGTHIMMCILQFQETEKVTSDFLAASVNTNPVIIRNILGKLKKAGLVSVEAGIGGASLAKDPSQISLLDIFRAVETEEDLFRFHENPNPLGPVGGNIFPIVHAHLAEAQQAMEEKLGGITLKNLMDELQERLER